jgi:hypothetical protein
MKNFSYLILFFALFFSTLFVSAQETEEIKMKGITGIGYDENIVLAKEKAINEAKKNALNRAGIAVNINAYTDLFQAEMDDNYAELFTSQVFTNIRGAVTNIEVVSENRDFVMGNNIKYEVTIDCIVLKYNTDVDLMYAADIKGIKPFVNDGDLLKFTVTPTKDSWLYVFCVPQNQDKAYYLFPIEEEEHKEKSFMLEAGKTYEFPRNLELEYFLDATDKQTDRLIFVITKQNFPFTSRITYKNVTDWIFTIPPDQRIVESFAVTILPRD